MVAFLFRQERSLVWSDRIAWGELPLWSTKEIDFQEQGNGNGDGCRTSHGQVQKLKQQAIIEPGKGVNWPENILQDQNLKVRAF